MAKKTDRKALGRGLSALLGDTNPVPINPSATAGPPQIPQIPIDLIDTNPDQPRKTFNKAELEELASSLQRHGVIQPVVLRRAPGNNDRYQIVAGERRWRAAQIAGIHALPGIVKDINDRELLELAIIENVQRVDLDPVEEAQGYAQLVDTFGYTQEELAQIIGKSRSHLANAMRLLSLPDPVLALVRSGKLSAGHARALITSSDPTGLAQKAVQSGLSVRQTEAMAKSFGSATRSKPPAAEKDADTRVLEGDLSAAIGMKVSIEHMTTEGAGNLVIRYGSLEDLDRLCQKLTE